MKKTNLKDVAKMMKTLDFCMMITRDGRGALHSRPMSNNGKVDYDGDLWFFSNLDTAKVRQIETNNKVSLIFQTDDMVFLDCYGTATIVSDKELIKEKWVKDLEQWFPEGPESDDICLIKVTAERIQFWGSKGDGEYRAD